MIIKDSNVLTVADYIKILSQYPQDLPIVKNPTAKFSAGFLSYELSAYEVKYEDSNFPIQGFCVPASKMYIPGENMHTIGSPRNYTYAAKCIFSGDIKEGTIPNNCIPVVFI